MLYIYDLDDTTVDSSHRQRKNADGSIDLAHWFANNTPDKIALDALLPLAEHLKMRNKKGDETMVCTSRQMTEADYQFLIDKGINPVYILSRKHGDNTPCGKMKLDLLSRFADRMGLAWGEFIKHTVMFDDNDDVLNTLSEKGLTTIDARKYS